MKRLQNITIKRSRGTFNKMSIINKIRALKASASKKQFDVPKIEGSATPESEGEMLWSPHSWFSECRNLSACSCHDAALQHVFPQ